jgi:multicomponent Na+:H+ antiporter subunit D
MRVSLLTLAAGCLASGALAEPFVERVAAPSAALLLRPGAYAHVTLGTRSRVPELPVSFDYFHATTLLTAAAEIVGGIVLLVVIVRVPAVTAPINALRRLHTGSVNDYAAFAAIGTAVAAYTLLA